MPIHFPKGSVGQSGGEFISNVVFATNTTVASYSESHGTTDTHTLVTSPSITPQSTNSRFLILASGNAGTTNYNYAYEFTLKLYRNQSGNAGFFGGNTNSSYFKGTNVIAGCNSGSEQGNNKTIFYIDHPNSTNSVTYQLEFIGNESETYNINRNKQDSSYNFPNTGGCYICVMEVCTV
tara:strand:+ start:342 stop:878 length:537 start_codon:yes stop_codon:yes gene_type:complete